MSNYRKSLPNDALNDTSIDIPANKYATGLWTGILFVGCGLMGILAHSRWYVRHQILYFLVASILAVVFSAFAIAMTSYGIHRRNVSRLGSLRQEYYYAPFSTAFNEVTESQFTSWVTANILVAAMMELFW